MSLMGIRKRGRSPNFTRHRDLSIRYPASKSMNTAKFKGTERL